MQLLNCTCTFETRQTKQQPTIPSSRQPTTPSTAETPTTTASTTKTAKTTTSKQTAPYTAHDTPGKPGGGGEQEIFTTYWKSTRLVESLRLNLHGVHHLVRVYQADRDSYSRYFRHTHYITACCCWGAMFMFNQTALGAALSSSTLLCLRSSFLPPAAGLGLPGGIVLRAVFTTAGGVVLPGLLSSRREVVLLAGGKVPPPELLFSSRRDIDLRTVLFSRSAATAAEAVATAVSSPREIVREGARLGTTRFICLRWVRSFVPLGRANHLAPRCGRRQQQRLRSFLVCKRYLMRSKTGLVHMHMNVCATIKCEN